MDSSPTVSLLADTSSELSAVVVVGSARPTRVFKELLREFRVSYLLLILMNIGVCAIYFWQYIHCKSGCSNQCDDDNDSYLIDWELAALVNFGCSACYYMLALLPAFSLRRILRFAAIVQETVNSDEITEEPYESLSPTDKRKRRKVLNNLIASHFRSHFKLVQLFHLLITLLHLTLVFSGIFLFFAKQYSAIMFVTNPLMVNDCGFSSAWLIFCTIILICIAKKSALQIAVLLITASPILLCYISIKLLRRDSQSQENSLLEDEYFKSITSVVYHPKSIEGDDHSCAICHSDYSMGSSLKVLPCSELHHFHEKCIFTWFRISKTCPLCRFSLQSVRQPLNEEEEQVRS